MHTIETLANNKTPVAKHQKSIHIPPSRVTASTTCPTYLVLVNRSKKFAALTRTGSVV